MFASVRLRCVCAKSVNGLSLGCPMAWLGGGSRSLCSWAPELLLATAVNQITALEQTKGRGAEKGTSPPPETRARHPPLVVRASEQP